MKNFITLVLFIALVSFSFATSAHAAFFDFPSFGDSVSSSGRGSGGSNGDSEGDAGDWGGQENDGVVVTSGEETATVSVNITINNNDFDQDDLGEDGRLPNVPGRDDVDVVIEGEGSDVSVSVEFSDDSRSRRGSRISDPRSPQGLNSIFDFVELGVF